MKQSFYAQPGTTIAAAEAMKQIIHFHNQGKKEAEIDKKRLKVIRNAGVIK